MKVTTLKVTKRQHDIWIESDIDSAKECFDTLDMMEVLVEQFL